jgi:DNA polymerase III subunit epsilon
LYAIVDIETTGGRPSFDKITEIAIIIYDGNAIVQRFSTLINPECNIPYYITDITGITNQMVLDAPKFCNVANQILQLTQNCVFVAHNVSFDYNFIKNSFKNIGYNFNLPTLCTVKLSRKTFLGLPSYSLGRLCNSLGIEIKARHRAMGDAEATAIVFDKIAKTNPQLLFT